MAEMREGDGGQRNRERSEKEGEREEGLGDGRTLSISPAADHAKNKTFHPVQPMLFTG
jgi:hypothetical protein